MNENGYDNHQQYNNGYNQQYSDQQYNNAQPSNNGYNQQYGSQQYNNGYDQNGYDRQFNNSPQVQVWLPEGISSRLPEKWRDRIEDTLTDAARSAQNPYEQVVPRKEEPFIRPVFAIVAMVILFVGCFFLMNGNTAGFVFSFGVTCVLIGIGVITDKRTSLKRNTKSCIWLIFGIEVILASGYQMLAKSNASLQIMDEKTLGMVTGIIFGSLAPMFLGLHFVNYQFRKKICSQEVQAVCVYVQKRFSKKRNSSTPQYIPVYEFTFQGNPYCVARPAKNQVTSRSAFSGTKVYNVSSVGEQYDLMINPEDPTEFYLKNESPSISVWVLAIIALAFGYMFFNTTIK